MVNRILIDKNNDLKLKVESMHSDITSLNNEISRNKTNDENQKEYHLHSPAHSLNKYVYNRFDPSTDD